LIVDLVFVEVYQERQEQNGGDDQDEDQTKTDEHVPHNVLS
jgi:hypothetical protein